MALESASEAPTLMRGAPMAFIESASDVPTLIAGTPMALERECERGLRYMCYKGRSYKGASEVPTLYNRSKTATLRAREQAILLYEWRHSTESPP
jgi:hypothetical protein